jgi:pre-mRNA-splicing factor 18
MIRRADMFQKEKDAYLEKQRQLDKEQLLDVKGQNADELIDQKLSATTSDNVPRAEVIRRLRTRGQPIRLFAESDTEALKRLRKLEIERPELNEGWKNDFQAALSQVENEVMEKIVSGSSGTNDAEKLNIQVDESENDTTWEQILVCYFKRY